MGTETGIDAGPLSVVTEDYGVGSAGTGVAGGVSTGLQESSLPVAGVNSGSAGAGGDTTDGREAGARSRKESLTCTSETVRARVWSDNMAQTWARLSCDWATSLCGQRSTGVTISACDSLHQPTRMSG